MSTHRSISPRRHHKLAGYRLRRDAVTGRYTRAGDRPQGTPSPDERHRLLDLSTLELIDVVASELAARPEMHLVRNQVTALLAMAPTLTDRTQAVRIGADLVDDAIAQAEIEQAARRHILDHPMLTASQVAAVLHRPASDRTFASRLRTTGKVVALPVGNSYRYPAFQFDEATASVRDTVAAVNTALGAAADPWGVASWWLTPSTRLPEGQTPADLAADPDPAASKKLERLAAAVLPD
ncbi:hypothetical protein C8E05_7034 [Rhodococcus wratislaviensis]|uniref:Uncharacterized protein n=1 Tax=Rhodococcus wratislaviensis TaxID=44752 RepID=A0AB38F7B1_RHOWR|nr:hypothetical protein [Rhodococcus wratislaviensis]REE77512.1 hypothetical protein C8E05_7034 [Rhodococcus wratislaviensis]SPZ35362.1 Uncharacterised protein [Rhodococcus wratislaviensis]